MSTNENTRFHWFIGVALVMAAAGGVVFFVLKAGAKKMPDAERKALFAEERALLNELGQLTLELENIDRTVFLRTKMTVKEQEEAKAEDRRNFSPATGGHPRNSPGHAAFLQQRIDELTERLHEIEEEFRARGEPHW